MREITDHIVEADSANHLYWIEGHNALCDPLVNECARWKATFSFQNGPIKEVGINGVTHEALLAIVIDRLSAFQAGPYACLENHVALAHCEDALRCLHVRTRARIARGVEGTHHK